MTNNRRIIYYYQTFDSLSPLMNMNCPVTHIHLSSIHFGINNDGSPYIHLNDLSPNDPKFNTMWQEIETMYNLNVKIILMVGGAGGAFGNLFSNYDTYLKMLIDTIKQYNVISGIDLDIEEGVELQNIEQLITDIINEFGENFIITCAPLGSSLTSNVSGMGGFKYKDLANSNVGKYIQYYNGQFYGEYNSQIFDQCIDNGWQPNQIVMGMLSGQDFNNVCQTLEEICEKYENIGGCFIWEYFNAPSGWHQRVDNIFKNIHPQNKSFFHSLMNNIYNITNLLPNYFRTLIYK